MPVVVQAGYSDLEGVGIAIAEEGKPRRDVNLVLPKIECIDTYDRAPEAWNNASGEYDGKWPGYSGELAIDEQLDFAE